MERKSFKTLNTIIFLSILLGSTLVSGSSITAITAIADTPKYGGILRWGMVEDAFTLCPMTTNRLTVKWPASQIFSALLYYSDPDMKPIPDLAESYKISIDGLIYTFQLRKNAIWHDGVPVTSADVNWTFYNALIPYGVSGSTYKIATCTCPDDYTVVFTLKTPFAPFIDLFGMWNFPILPKHIYEGTDLVTNKNNFENTIGCGPFKLKEWVRGDHITLVRNDNYYIEGQPYLDKIIYKVIPDPTMLIMALKNGEIDAAPGIVPISAIKDLRANPNIECPDPYDVGASQIQIAFNVRSPPFDNKLVRQAFWYAIDVNAINEKCCFGLRQKSISHLTNWPLFDWCIDRNLTPYTYNPKKAEQLLDEAGYKMGPDGIRFSVTFIPDPQESSLHPGSTDMIKDYLATVGINLIIKQMASAAWQDAVYNRFDFQMTGHTLMTGPDPNIAFRNALDSRNIRPVYRGNAYGYKNSRVDQLFDLAATETDQTIRAKYFKEIQEIVWDEVPCIVLFDFKNYGAWSKDFQGWTSWQMVGEEPHGMVYWVKGSDISPTGAADAITNAEKEIAKLASQYYDVSLAQNKINEAKQALVTGNYANAYKLAKDALNLSQPPYWLYAIGIIVIVVVIGGTLYYRKLIGSRNIKSPSSMK